MSAEAALQTAIFQKLDTDLSVPVYSAGDTPNNARGLYVVMGNDTMVEWGTDGLNGFEATVVIHSWDTTDGNRSFIPLKTVMGGVYNSLHRANLSTVGYNTVGLDFEFSETMLDPDGLTRHGVQRFRILMRAE